VKFFYVEKEAKQKAEIKLEIEKKKMRKNYQILHLQRAISKLEIQNEKKHNDNQHLKSTLTSAKETVQKLVENKLFPNSTSKSRPSEIDAFESFNIQEIGDSDENLFQDFNLDDEKANEVIESMEIDSDPDLIILE